MPDFQFARWNNVRTKSAVHAHVHSLPDHIYNGHAKLKWISIVNGTERQVAIIFSMLDALYTWIERTKQVNGESTSSSQRRCIEWFDFLKWQFYQYPLRLGINPKSVKAFPNQIWCEWYTNDDTKWKHCKQSLKYIDKKPWAWTFWWALHCRKVVNKQLHLLLDS